MMGTAEVPHDHMAPAPRQSFLQNFGRICGAVGVVLLVSTPLTWLLTSEFGPLVWGKLIIGGALSGCYLATNADFFGRMVGARSTGLFALSTVSSMLTLALVGGVNFLAYLHPQEWDMTKEGLYTFSEQTTSVMKRLQHQVDVTAFYASYDASFAPVQETLERYKKQNPEKFHYAMVDPQSRPDLVEKYHITERGPRIVVSARQQEARVKTPEEQELTNAVVKVAEQTDKTVYFLTGHGEAEVDNGENPEGYKVLADAIGAEGYSVDVLNLAAPQDKGLSEKVSLNDKGPAAHAAGLEVPAEVAVLVVAGPRRPLLEPEVAAIEAYLDRGGRMVALLEPHLQSGLENLLKTYKIDVLDDIIVDTNPLNRLLGLGPAAPMIQPAAGEHPIIKDAAAPMVMLTARSLQVLPGGAPEVVAEALAHTGETAWGETHVGEDGTAGKDADDHLPPLDVAVASSKDIGERANKLSPQARLVVFGDADWASNRYLSMQGNQDFMLNTIHWAAEQEQKIAIRPKTRASSQLFLSGEQLNKLKFFSMDMMPMLLVAFGLGVVLVRRQR